MQRFKNILNIDEATVEVVLSLSRSLSLYLSLTPSKHLVGA